MHRGKLDLKYAANSSSWAIGHQQPNGFQVRRVVWGLMLAFEELRDGEEIRAARIQIERKHRKRSKPK